MENITFSEHDTDQEKLNVVNRIIDNMNLIEGKLLQIISKDKSDKKTSKKGGK